MKTYFPVFTKTVHFISERFAYFISHTATVGYRIVDIPTLIAGNGIQHNLHGQSTLLNHTKINF